MFLIIFVFVYLQAHQGRESHNVRFIMPTNFGETTQIQ
jgi:hypothetical protein